MIHRKRSSVGIISSRTFIKVATKPSITTTSTRTIKFSTSYSSSATGSVVKHNEKTSFILTAAHVCTLAYERQVKQVFPFYNKEKYDLHFNQIIAIYDITGKKHRAVPLIWSKMYDICIMVTSKIDQPALELAGGPPYRGEKIYYMGFPRGFGGGKFIPAFEGFYLGTMSKARMGRGVVAGYSIPIAPGSSGSAVLNIYGDIIGVLHSYYPAFEHIGLSATYPQLKSLFEEADAAYIKSRKFILKELKSWSYWL
jgi:S1-C subfamily serine protease